MEMTNKQIIDMYQHSKHPGRQVKILAELNDCSEEEILEILGLKEIEKPTEITKEDPLESWLHKKMDETDKKIKELENLYKNYVAALSVLAEYNSTGGAK